MEINRNAPATADGELRIDADPRTLDKGIRSVLAHFKTEAEQRAAPT